MKGVNFENLRTYPSLDGWLQWQLQAEELFKQGLAIQYGNGMDTRLQQGMLIKTF
jgi:hypothetical protein